MRSQRSSIESAYTLRVPMYNDLVTKQGIVGADAILKLIDVAGCIPAKRHLGDALDPVTASIDGLDFYAPVYAWNILELDARITQVWGTSMETRVVVTSWDFRTNSTWIVATGYVVTVATEDRGGRKTTAEQVPALKLITPEDHLLAKFADQRKALRQKEREQVASIPEWQPMQNEEMLACSRLPLEASHGNGLQQNVFGGVTLAMLLKTAREAAMAWVGHSEVVAVRQDRTHFRSPALIGEIMFTKACISATWNSSFEVQVECYTQSAHDADAQPRLIAHTYCVFVQLEEGSHRPLPLATEHRLMPATLSPEALHRSEQANQRRHYRQEEAQWFEV